MGSDERILSIVTGELEGWYPEVRWYEFNFDRISVSLYVKGSL